MSKPITTEFMNEWGRGHQPAYILSRSAAEKLLQDGFPRNTFVISFYDPPSKRTGQVSQPLDYRGMPLDVFYVPLHDIDLEILEEYGLSYDTYFPEAPALAAFIYDAMENGGNIVCQCEYGQSRSAACAAAIREHFYGEGIELFADYRYYPNQLVYNKLKAALDAEKLRWDGDGYGLRQTAGDAAEAEKSVPSRQIRGRLRRAPGLLLFQSPTSRHNAAAPEALPEESPAV